jgi:microcystin-dependent protein
MPADLTTPNYGWTLPDVGGDATTWGATLNSDLLAIDAQVYANEQSGVPVGAITMFAGATPPSNWLICDGRAVDTTIYAKLYAVIGNTYGGVGSQGNFFLPNLLGRFPVGSDGSTYNIGATGGEATHTLLQAEMPTHTHGVNEPGHTHGVNDPTHTHGVSDPMHSHSMPDTPSPALSGQSGVAGGVGWGWGSQGTTASATGISIQSAATGIGIAAAATGVTIQNAGGGGAHNNLPPYLGVNFIIRFQ